jgi:broad specificity phosphatase PhoE
VTVHLVYETHSVTEDNEAGVATGWLPGRLSERGRRLAVELGQRRPASGFAAVWSSDLARVRREHVDTPCPGGGQSYREVVDATARFLADLRREHQGERVLVIAHSANRWALQHLLDGTALEQLVTAPFAWRPGWEWTLT